MTRSRPDGRASLRSFGAALLAALIAISGVPAGAMSASSTPTARSAPIAAAAPATKDPRIKKSARFAATRMRHPGSAKVGAGLKAPSGIGSVAASSLVTPGSGVSATSAWSMNADLESSENPSIAASSALAMLATADVVVWKDVTGMPGAGDAVAPYNLFALPLDEYYLPPTVAYSAKVGRFIAVMPSLKDEATNCSTGYLNIGISKTSDPSAGWLKVKVNIGTAFADVAWIGLADDKAVMTTNEWNLFDDPTLGCIGNAYEGSRIRVVDLADLMDGSSATVRDLGIGANYFNWYPVNEPPPPGSSSAGTTVDLVGEQFVGGQWGHVAYARVTGSAKANTATLGTSLTDLTAGGVVDALAAPPDIPSIPGNPDFDERMSAVAGRPGELWFAAATTCTPTGDSAARGCARFVALDTSTSPPTLLQDGTYGTIGQDTFLPAVGMSRDGKVFLRTTRAASSGGATLHQEIVALDPGGAMDGGPQAVRYWTGSGSLSSSNWAFLSTFAFDPGAVDRVLNVGPANWSANQLESKITRFRGGISDDPDGTTLVNNDRPWSNSLRAEFAPTPLASSPIITMRVSAQGTTETTAGGERLLQAVDLPVGWYYYADLNKPELGGTDGEGTHSAWVQFGTGDGRWSAPVAHTFQVDQTAPVVTVPLASGFATGYTVGTTAAVRTTWDGTDDGGSGIVAWQLNRLLSGSGYYSVTLPGATRSVVHALSLTKTYKYDIQPRDLAGNPSLGAAYGTPISPRVYQGTSTAIKYTTGFGTSTSSSYLGGSTRYASVAGKYASFTFTGRSVAFVSTKAKTRGKVYVYLDGVKKATVDLYSSTTSYRQIVWAMNVPYGTHKVTVKVAGTSGRPRVDFDAFLKL